MGYVHYLVRVRVVVMVIARMRIRSMLEFRVILRDTMLTMRFG